MNGQVARKIVLDVTLFALSQVALYYGVKWVLNSLDPMSKKRKDAKSASRDVLGRLGRNLRELQLNEHEEIIAAEVVHPDDLHVTFNDIGGLEGIIDSLNETVIYPLCHPHLFSSASGLLGAPKGVLLYGPPGCGKTLLAKALAKESGASFLNIHVSTLTEKWFGESQKLVRAVFSLARKLQPCIVFIDEVDAFLRTRASSDHEATGMMKAEFMTLWDGLATGGDARILVLGATNRPNDIDPAILRRMPKRFHIRLPDVEQRKKVLKLLLKDTRLAGGFNWDELAIRTSGLSGSDLKELCRNAAMSPVREAIRTLRSESGSNPPSVDAEKMEVRPLRMSDFFHGDLTSGGLAKGRDGTLEDLQLD